MIQRLTDILKNKPLTLYNEKTLQMEIAMLLQSNQIEHEREVVLEKGSVIDFLIDGVGIEIKIKGNKSSIFRQCKRYCKNDKINQLILVTNKAMGLPAEIEGKPCYILNLGESWL